MRTLITINLVERAFILFACYCAARGWLTPLAGVAAASIIFLMLCLVILAQERWWPRSPGGEP